MNLLEYLLASVLGLSLLFGCAGLLSTLCSFHNELAQKWAVQDRMRTLFLVLKAKMRQSGLDAQTGHIFVQSPLHNSAVQSILNGHRSTSDPLILPRACLEVEPCYSVLFVTKKAGASRLSIVNLPNGNLDVLMPEVQAMHVQYLVLNAQGIFDLRSMGAIQNWTQVFGMVVHIVPEKSAQADQIEVVLNAPR